MCLRSNVQTMMYQFACMLLTSGLPISCRNDDKHVLNCLLGWSRMLVIWLDTLISEQLIGSVFERLCQHLCIYAPAATRNTLLKRTMHQGSKQTGDSPCAAKVTANFKSHHCWSGLECLPGILCLQKQVLDHPLPDLMS